MAKKKTFGVTLPIVGQIYVEVKAVDEESAIEAALSSELVNNQIEEWQALRCIVEGNVCHAQINEAYAEVVDDE